MRNSLVLLVSFFYSSALLACPYCLGDSQGGKDTNTTLIISCFILAAYIPYLIILRLIKKQKAIESSRTIE